MYDVKNESLTKVEASSRSLVDARRRDLLGARDHLLDPIDTSRVEASVPSWRR
jgi:hypothetical protein